MVKIYIEEYFALETFAHTNVALRFFFGHIRCASNSYLRPVRFDITVKYECGNFAYFKLE